MAVSTDLTNTTWKINNTTFAAGTYIGYGYLILNDTDYSEIEFEIGFGYYAQEGSLSENPMANYVGINGYDETAGEYISINLTQNDIITLVGEDGYYSDPDFKDCLAKCATLLNGDKWIMPNTLTDGITYEIPDDTVFVSNSLTYNSIYTTQDSETGDQVLFYAYINQSDVTVRSIEVYNFDTDTWSNNVYKTIEIGISDDMSELADTLTEWGAKKKGTYRLGWRINSNN